MKTKINAPRAAFALGLILSLQTSIFAQERPVLLPALAAIPRASAEPALSATTILAAAPALVLPSAVSPLSAAPSVVLPGAAPLAAGTASVPADRSQARQELSAMQQITSPTGSGDLSVAYDHSAPAAPLSVEDSRQQEPSLIINPYDMERWTSGDKAQYLYDSLDLPEEAVEAGVTMKRFETADKRLVLEAVRVANPNGKFWEVKPEYVSRVRLNTKNQPEKGSSSYYGDANNYYHGAGEFYPTHDDAVRLGKAIRLPGVGYEGKLNFAIAIIHTYNELGHLRVYVPFEPKFAAPVPAPSVHVHSGPVIVQPETLWSDIKKALSSR